MKCKNCEEDIKKDWTVCPKCGANLKLGTYSANDDPVKRIETVEGDVKKIKKYLEEKHAEQDKGNKERKTLFGD
jgi:zinc ribbon protein